MRGTGRRPPRCSARKKGIPDHEPDVVLRSAGRRPARVRLYHERCSGAAVRLVVSMPAAWLMTVRHVEEMAN